MRKWRAKFKEHQIFVKPVKKGQGVLYRIKDGAKIVGNRSDGVLICDTLGNIQFDGRGWESPLLYGYKPIYLQDEWCVCEPSSKTVQFLAIYHSESVYGKSIMDLGFEMDDVTCIMSGLGLTRRYVADIGRVIHDMMPVAEACAEFKKLLKSNIEVPCVDYPEWMHGKGDFVLLQENCTVRYMLGADFANRFSNRGWKGFVPDTKVECISLDEIIGRA